MWSSQRSSHHTSSTTGSDPPPHTQPCTGAAEDSEEDTRGTPGPTTPGIPLPTPAVPTASPGATHRPQRGRRLLGLLLGTTTSSSPWATTEPITAAQSPTGITIATERGAAAAVRVDTGVIPGARTELGKSLVAEAEAAPGPDPGADPGLGPGLGAEAAAGGGATVKGADLAVRVSAAVAPVQPPATTTKHSLRGKKPLHHSPRNPS